jgi:hypothetical protein
MGLAAGRHVLAVILAVKNFRRSGAGFTPKSPDWRMSGLGLDGWKKTWANPDRRVNVIKPVQFFYGVASFSFANPASLPLLS